MRSCLHKGRCTGVSVRAVARVLSDPSCKLPRECRCVAEERELGCMPRAPEKNRVLQKA